MKGYQYAVVIQDVYVVVHCLVSVLNGYGSTLSHHGSIRNRGVVSEILSARGPLIPTWARAVGVWGLSGS